MSSILPILEYEEGFTVTGVSTKTQNTDEFNEKQRDYLDFGNNFTPVI